VTLWVQCNNITHPHPLTLPHNHSLPPLNLRAHRYNDPRSAVAITKWAKSLGLGGVFIFDSSMDTISGGQFTYEISNAIANELAAP